jgi:hypothetical protein
MKKKQSNAWLESQEFLKKTGFQDLFYLESLCYHIASFLKNVPLPVVTSHDIGFTNSIFFVVGDKIKNGFKIDTNIAPYDYITLVKRWLYQYYPKYSYKYDEQVPYSDEEIIALHKQGQDLNDLLQLRKSVQKVEIGIIEKEMRVKDQFILNRNGIRELWLTGSLKDPMTLTEFKDTLLRISDDVERRLFIFAHARPIQVLDASTKDINVNYIGYQMLNFFKINYDDLKQYEVKEVVPFVYRWGRFVCKFDSRSLMLECLNYIEKRKKGEIS